MGSCRPSPIRICFTSAVIVSLIVNYNQTFNLQVAISNNGLLFCKIFAGRICTKAFFRPMACPNRSNFGPWRFDKTARRKKTSILNWGTPGCIFLFRFRLTGQGCSGFLFRFQLTGQGRPKRPQYPKLRGCPWRLKYPKLRGCPWKLKYPKLRECPWRPTYPKLKGVPGGLSTPSSGGAPEGLSTPSSGGVPGGLSTPSSGGVPGCLSTPSSGGVP